MAKFIINETDGQFAGMPGQNVEVEAESFEERGSFTVFLDVEMNDVFSMKTEKVRTVRRADAS